MNKEEALREMSYIVVNNGCDIRKSLEEIYNAGYRKMQGDHIVLYDNDCMTVIAVNKSFETIKEEIQRDTATEVLKTIIDESSVDLLLGKYILSRATVNKIKRKYGIKEL